MTLLITSAAKLSPFLMSWRDLLGVGGEVGVHDAERGQRAVVGVRENWLVLRTCRMYLPIPNGKTSAVNCRSF